MRKTITREDVLAYRNQGMKEIVVDEAPIVTDLAKDALREFGISVRVGGQAAAPAGAPAPARTGGGSSSGGGGGYGAGGGVTDPYANPKAMQLATPTLNKRPFKEVIRGNKKLAGTFIGTPHPVITEFVGHLGFDFVCIDAEHNAIHFETVQKMLQGLQPTPTYGMVRVPMISYEYITGALDIGADAILVPQIRTTEDMDRIFEFSQYPPIGRRGCGPGRLWDYGDGIGQLGTQGDANYTTNVVPQIETVSAIQNLDKILQYDFVDMYFIGPGDLSMDMGIFGQFSNPKLTDAIMLIRRETAAAGKKLGVFAGTFEAAANWMDKGFDMCIINSELALLSTAVGQGFKALQGKL